jgi:hypothetical protein
MRSRVPGGRARLAPPVNPRQVGGGERAQFGAPVRLSLDGNGFRGIDDDAASARRTIVAGPPADGGPFRLSRRDGDARDNSLRIGHADLSTSHPEAPVSYDRPRPGVRVRSDDGDARTSETRRQDRPAADRRFRATAWTP